MKTSLVSLLSTIALLQCAPTAFATPSKLKGAKSAAPKKGVENRECKSKVSKKNEVAVKCTSSTAEELQSRGIFLDPADEIRDMINYKVKADKKGVQVKVEYKQEFDDEDGSSQKGMENVTETKTKFEVVFDSIIEYAKPDNSGRSDEEQAYVWEEDNVLQTLELGDWGTMTAVQDDDDGIISNFNVYSEDMVVMFNFTIARANIGLAKANTMKIDILIADFPWMRNDTNLALLSTVTSELKVKMEYDEEAITREEHDGHFHSNTKRAKDIQIAFDDATEEIGSAPFGKYSWQDNADATSDIALESDLECQPEVLVGRSADNIPSHCGNVTASELVQVENQKQSIRVVATSPEMEDETFQAIAYSFVGKTAHHASEIYWDPEAGIGYGSNALDGSAEIEFDGGEERASSSGSASFGIASALALVSMSLLSC